MTLDEWLKEKQALCDAASENWDSTVNIRIADSLSTALEIIRRQGEALDANGLQCKNTGMYGPMGLRPGECTCSSCLAKKALSLDPMAIEKEMK